MSEDFQQMIETRGRTVIEDHINNGMLELAHQVDEALAAQYPDYISYFSPTRSYLGQFLTESPSMLELKRTIELLAPIQDNVLLRGPTGTGKELLAHALHGDRKGPFVELNCAGMPEHLIESELFGHMKGSFTGADKETIGLFEQATNGTIFLDEIGELPILLQAKLLRVLQDKCVRKVGGKEPIGPIKFRLVSATHQDLATLINMRLFRADLYHRISTFEEFTKPLSERPNDALLIVKSLLNSKQQETIPSGLVDAIAKDRLEGNVRTLQAMVRRWQVKGKI
jgi:transcriptional regulator with PAS, ATPase and Fis domain